MPRLMLELTREEIHMEIPYAMVCMGHEGAAWNTMHRKRRWATEFSEHERRASEAIFRKAHSWMLTTGVPDVVRMTFDTFHLWQKLGDFCASI